MCKIFFAEVLAIELSFKVRELVCQLVIIKLWCCSLVGLCFISVTRLMLLFFFFLYPQGGIHGKISLTAYVVAALLETGITTEVGRPTKTAQCEISAMGMRCKESDAAAVQVGS